MSFTLAAWLHNLNPFIVELSSGIGIRWYGTAYAAGFVVGWMLLRWLAKKSVTPLSYERIADSMLVLCIGVVLGGRLGYVAFYDPSLLWSFTDKAPFWGVLMLNRGGMASHGGMIGVLTACWWISRGVKNESGERVGALPMLHVMDLTALACTPGLFFGRLANFINGELLGDIVAAPGQPAPWWAVKFPQEHFSGHAPVLSPKQQVDLVRLLESYYPGTEPDGAYDRLLHLIQSRTPEATAAAAKLAPFIAARHPSQLYQAAAEGLVLGTTLLLLWAVPRRPGFIVAMFLIMYGAMRILTELYRLPDADLGRVMGLSRGQWLSVLMIGMGLIPMYLSTRRKDVYGGWWKRAGDVTR